VLATVFLPRPDAELWVEGQKTRSSGPTRRFVSPPLQPGKYTYRFQARWSESGTLMELTREVRVQPGDRITVDFAGPGR
jgi:uncharacterized protein (TIGR03000 family)